jgi:hypothetical protein
MDYWIDGLLGAVLKYSAIHLIKLHYSTTPTIQQSNHPFMEPEENMKFNLKALTLTAGILWAVAVLLTGIANLIWPGYGTTFLQCMSSVYPGYHATRSFGDLIVGTLYSLVDGAICGLVFGWLYNLFVGKSSAT